jgi:hypothetical protein
MPQRHYPPAYLRYFRARLWNLARPGFWGTAIFLSVVGLVIKEYWVQPDLANRQDEQVDAKSAKAPLAPEDRAIAADIDNLPLLVNDSLPANLPKVKNPNPNQANKNKTLLDRLNDRDRSSASSNKLVSDDKSANSTSVNKIDNPFLTQAESLLKFSNLQNANQPTSSQFAVGQTSLGLGLGSNTGTDARQNITQESALQTALNKTTSQNQISQVNSTTNQVNPFNTLTPRSGTSVQNPIPTNGAMGGGNNLPSNINYGSGYNIQPGIGTQPQNINLGTNYTPEGQTGFVPQNPVVPGTNYTQPLPANQLQNTIPPTGYVQPGITNQPQVNQLPNSLPSSTVPGVNYTQPTQLYQPQSFYTNRDDRNLANFIDFVKRRSEYSTGNSTPALPNIPQQTPAIPSAPTSVPYYNSVTNQGTVINYPNSTIPNYGSSGLPQQSIPQYNYGSPGQIPGQ